MENWVNLMRFKSELNIKLTSIKVRYILFELPPNTRHVIKRDKWHGSINKNKHMVVIQKISII